MDLKELANRAVIVKQAGHSYFCDITKLLTGAGCFGLASRGLMEEFERFEREHSERYLNKVVGLGEIGIAVSASVAAVSERALVPFRSADRRVYDQGDRLHCYYHDGVSHRLQMPAASISPSDAVLIVADALLSGYTLLAAAELIQSAGAELIGALTLVEVPELGGRARLEHFGYEVRSVLKVPLGR